MRRSIPCRWSLQHGTPAATGPVADRACRAAPRSDRGSDSRGRHIGSPGDRSVPRHADPPSGSLLSLRRLFGLFGRQIADQAAEPVLERMPWDDHVDHAVFEQIFGSLEALRLLLSVVLFISHITG